MQKYVCHSVWTINVKLRIKVVRLLLFPHTLQVKVKYWKRSRNYVGSKHDFYFSSTLWAFALCIRTALFTPFRPHAELSWEFYNIFIKSIKISASLGECICFKSVANDKFVTKILETMLPKFGRQEPFVVFTLSCGQKYPSTSRIWFTYWKKTE